MNKAVWTVVKLRMALTMSTVNKSAWQAIGFVISCMFALSFIAGAWVAGWALTLVVPPTKEGARLSALYLAIGWTFAVIFVGISQMIAFGQQGVNAKNLYRFGLRRRDIRNAVIMSSILTPSGVATFVALLGFTGMLGAHFVGGLPAKIFIWAIAVISSGLSVVFSATLLSTVGTAANVIVRSKKARNIVSTVFVIVIIIMSQSMSLVGSFFGAEGVDPAQVDYRGVEALGTLLQWTPFANFVAMPLALSASGAYTAIMFLVGGALYVGALWLMAWCFDWCMQRDIVLGSTVITNARVKGHGLGLFASGFVRGRFSAVVARIATSWTRDIRYSISLFLPLLFVVIFGAQSAISGEPDMILMAIPMSGYFICFLGVNMLAYDGPAFILHTISGVKGRVDWFARSSFQLCLGLVMQVIVTVVTLAIFRNNIDFMFLAFIESVGICLMLCGIGSSATLSPVLMYPVPTAEQPMKTPQGRTMMQMLIPFIFLLLLVALFIPGGVTLLIGWLSGAAFDAVLPYAVVVQLIFSVAFYIGGNLLAGYLTDKRRLKIQSTLRDFAQLTR
ncbi:hypothetical protein [Alloscardovia criceti]|uniref:hypothetical protein n=1 Tax=Alloscardovia criceti TaxID=356828 RepID=UPI00035E570F|nr:hypothetical protein [Alloscardovia criceti]